MGLDMYLVAKRYVGGWDFSGEEERRMHRAIIDIVDAAPLVTSDATHLYVEVTCAYWRKANAVHAWFVRETQDGKDECQPSYVSREKLLELRALCSSIIESRDMAMASEELPTQDGFFFGSTEYDEWYMSDVESTIAKIDKALAAPDCWEFEYRASW